MKKLCLIVTLILAVFVATNNAQALDFDFSGVMANHNDVLLFNFTSGGVGNVTLFSSSWLDGNHGFDPMLGLWDGAGNLIDFQDDGGNIGTTYSNGVPYDHGNWDSYYSSSIGAGNYTVSLSAYANFNNGSNLSDGFSYDGQAPISIPSWSQPANGYQTGDYAFHILNVAQASGPGSPNEGGVVPEPATLSLLGLGLSGFLMRRRRAV